MVNFSFTNKAAVYKYDRGVNAANLTIEDINRANARLAPRRQELIKNNLLKATSDDPGYKPPIPLTPRPLFDYARWSKKALAKALLGRQLKTRQALKIM